MSNTKTSSKGYFNEKMLEILKKGEEKPKKTTTTKAKPAPKKKSK